MTTTATHKKRLLNDSGWPMQSTFYNDGIPVRVLADSGSSPATFDYDAEVQAAEQNCKNQYPVAAKNKGLGKQKDYNNCMSKAVSDTIAREKAFQTSSGNNALTGVLGSITGSSAPGGPSAASGTGAADTSGSSSSSTMIIGVLLVLALVGGYLFMNRNSSTPAAALIPPAK